MVVSGSIVYEVLLAAGGAMSNLHVINQQVAFIVEVDKLKSVLRKTSPIGLNRLENSAEHSWQVILCAILFEEHANEPVDLLKVIKMLAIHDVVEIDVGDTFHYDKPEVSDLYERELAAAKRVFGLLPEDQGQACLKLWIEFEHRETPEARYAAAVDRMIAILINSQSEGGSWSTHNISADLILAKNAHIENGATGLWHKVQQMVHDTCAQGHISPKRQQS